MQMTDSSGVGSLSARSASLGMPLQFSLPSVGSGVAPPLLRELARQVRLRCLKMTRKSEFGHLGPDFSAADLICTLYGAVLRFPNADLADHDRDRFILSKGHAALALYSVLVELGWWPAAMLENYGRAGGQLSGHPSGSVLGIETCTGALGHGLPFAVGAALAARAQNSARRTYVLVGDGELQEGSNWEAAMMAGMHGLDSLAVLVDRNRLQQGRGTETVNRLEPLADKWRAFGWTVAEVDGHDPDAILACLRRLPIESGSPTCILANTRKGRGVSFMEGNVAWHHKLPTHAEAELALAELESAA